MVLVTSRNPCWDLYVSLLELDRLSLIELLKNMTKINEPAEADLIVNELGDLPLALCQAECFIKQTTRIIMSTLLWLKLVCLISIIMMD